MSRASERPGDRPEQFDVREVARRMREAIDQGVEDAKDTAIAYASAGAIRATETIRAKVVGVAQAAIDRMNDRRGRRR